MDKQIQDLLLPISDSQPCGEDLSFSAEFDRIQEARREDDPTVDYGEWQTNLKQADWNEVVVVCSAILTSRSKDLRVAGWLGEAWIKTAGLRGLRQGAQLLCGLLEGYGKDIYPQAEDGDQEQRGGCISWYLGRMAALVRQVPLTAHGAARHSLNDYDVARQLQSQLHKNPDLNVEDKLTLDKIASAAVKTDRGLYIDWLEEGELCKHALSRLGQALEQSFGDDAPSLTPLQRALDAVRDQLGAIARERGIGNAPAAPVQDVPSAAEQQAVPRPREVAAGPINSREQALAALREVAEFFRRTEPHSPVAYLADKAVHWGTMPLHEWLRKVVKDGGTLSHLEDMLGLDADKE